MGKIESLQAFSTIAQGALGSGLASGRATDLRVRGGAQDTPGGLAVGSRAPLWEQWGPGQILELSGQRPGKLSTVVRLLLRAQAEGEPCAWIAARDAASFYPPDFAQAGVDLSALVVVRMPPEAGPHGVVRASELLLRSGAFGLVVLDFASAVPRGELAWQSRLSGLLRMHDARVVLLTPSEAHEPSLGPMVGLRIEPQLSALAGARVALAQRVLKSKLGGGLAISPDIREAPLGAMRIP